MSLFLPVPEEACPRWCWIWKCCLSRLPAPCLALAWLQASASACGPLSRRWAAGLWGQVAMWERQCWDGSAHNHLSPCPLLPTSNVELSKSQHHWVQPLAGTWLGWVARGWWPGWVAFYVGGRDGAELGDRRLVELFGKGPIQPRQLLDRMVTVPQLSSTQRVTVQPFFCSGGIWGALGSKHWYSCLLSVHLSSCVRGELHLQGE